MNVADLRREYTQGGLREADVVADPLDQFRVWFRQAMTASVAEPNAMTLATAGPDGFPSARIVLLKGVDERGFTFFTNYQSRKGRELAENPRATLVFFWVELERQVRIEGTIEKVTDSESDAYFASRPRGSQLGAWVSEQSEPIVSRELLESRLGEVEAKYLGQTVPRPPHWGGYRLIPTTIEFWQGRENRLHDRLRYRFMDSHWRLDRLAP
jgi:pyridoxamine 5'-phosphate oxidase